jgi:hypothetical protein
VAGPVTVRVTLCPFIIFPEIEGAAGAVANEKRERESKSSDSVGFIMPGFGKPNIALIETVTLSRFSERNKFR